VRAFNRHHDRPGARRTSGPSGRRQRSPCAHVGQFLDESPRWSPDGRAIAFVVRSDEIAAALLCVEDSGQTAKLTTSKTLPSNLLLVLGRKADRVRQPGGRPAARNSQACFAAGRSQVGRASADLRSAHLSLQRRGYLKAGLHTAFRHRLGRRARPGNSPRAIFPMAVAVKGSAPVWTPDGKSLVISGFLRPISSTTAQHRGLTRSRWPTDRFTL